MRASMTPLHLRIAAVAVVLASFFVASCHVELSSSRTTTTTIGAASPAPKSVGGARAPSAVDRITADSIAGPLGFLSDDLFEGRGPGTRGDALSRAYLVSEFRRASLSPGVKLSSATGDPATRPASAGYDQPVPILGMTATVVAPLAAQGPQGTATFVAPEDYVAFSYRKDARLAWRDAEVVFVGYGITAPEQKWDDFKDVDVKGKVLLVMNDDPSSDPALFAGKTRLYYGRWSYKFEEAARRGALGVLLIHTTPSAGYPFQVIQSNHGQERFWLPFDEQPAMSISAWIAEGAAKKLASLGGADLDQLRAKAESRDFRPVPLGVKTSLLLANTTRNFDSGNVVGVLEGSDPKLKDEYVVVTAHFDHLGRGPAKNGDDIYNGALDNASGTAAMLTLMHALASDSARPRRSVIFLAVTGEESGLLGSEHYARRPTVPNRAIVADFNLDGVNIWGRTRDVGLIGHGKSTLTGVVERAAAAQGRVVTPDAEPDKGLFYRSDHFSFARVGVPSVYLKSGRDFLEDADTKRSVQLSYTALRYHQPSDAFDSRWNLAGAVEDVKLLYAALLDVANSDARPAWTKGDEFENSRP
jgi:Zn-dependent M28 family amino/carboxypeptidase